jgi:hypothetical protein
VASASSWIRATDADDNDEVTAGLFVFVEEGTLQGDTGWVLSTDDSITVGTTDLTFVQFSGAGTYTAGAGLTLIGSEFAADFEDDDGDIQSLGTADAGTSDYVARADHVHPHGDLAGGSFHAAAIASGASGFMTGTDKAKLDGIASGAEVNQNAWGVVDINTGETTLTAAGDADTLKFVEAQVINIVGSAGDTITIGLSPGSNDQILRTVGGVAQWDDLPEAATTFLSLTDTPDTSYATHGGKFVRVNSTPDELEFVDLDDSMIDISGTHTGILSGATTLDDAMTALDDLDVVPSSASAGSTLYYNSGWVESNIIFNDHANAEVGINTQTPNATLHVEGSVSMKIVTVTANYDMTSGTNSDLHTLLCNNTTGSITVTLPAVASSAGRVYHIKKISGAGNDVVIDGSSSETIDGANTYTLDIQYEAVTVVCDGTAWYIV